MAVKALRFLGIALAFISAPGWAEPLYVKDMGPVAGLFGLPSQRAARTLAPGEVDVEVISAVASHYIDEARNAERLHLDGETDRLAINLKYAFAEHWEVQLEVPWLRHSGGFLDSTIDGWHDFWGMPDGGRNDVPRDLLRYGYLGQDQFLLQDDASGVGDITLSLNQQFYTSETTTALVSLGYKFASGDEDEFLGSGGEDLYLALRAGGALGASGGISWFGQAGYLYAGSSDLIEHIQQQNLWFVGLGFAWEFAPRWSVLGQFDAHAAPADSAITGLGDDSLMFTGGLRWRPAPAWALEFSVVEDIRVETAPDVTFQFGVRYRAGSQ